MAINFGMTINFFMAINFVMAINLSIAINLRMVANLRILPHHPPLPTGPFQSSPSPKHHPLPALSLIEQILKYPNIDFQAKPFRTTNKQIINFQKQY